MYELVPEGIRAPPGARLRRLSGALDDF